MYIHPILSALRHHKIIAALIILEIAFAYAVICNAGFLIVERVARIQRPTGIAEEALLRLQLSPASQKDEDSLAQTRTDLLALRAIPGVLSATVVNQIPYGDSSTNSAVSMREDQATPTLDAAIYLAGSGVIQTLGLNLVAGRDFTGDDYVDWKSTDIPGEVVIPTAIVTRATAERLFPGEDAIGKSFYSWGGQPTRIVGIVERLTRPSEVDDPITMDYSVIFPVNLPYTSGANYVLRTTPQDSEATLKRALQALRLAGPPRVYGLNNGTIESLRDRYYRTDKAMAGLLVLVCTGLLIITLAGILGLSSFWVQQRTRTIGIRRALGATRKQVLHYFQVENLLLTTVGSFLGIAMAIGMNLLLMGYYELSRLPIEYSLLGIILLIPLGQLAVLPPAMRAITVSPAIATRSA
ncbi:FtsX-like permease family protein [Xanthomonas sp. 10-10]|uniref:FtsX-like permease family protein n=1 Tax=Xanthomonas sp. 10-10 TaxID=3115848 RepID=A0AAU7PBV9_9XANT